MLFPKVKIPTLSILSFIVLSFSLSPFFFFCLELKKIAAQSNLLHTKELPITIDMVPDINRQQSMLTNLEP